MKEKQRLCMEESKHKEGDTQRRGYTKEEIHKGGDIQRRGHTKERTHKGGDTQRRGHTKECTCGRRRVHTKKKLQFSYVLLEECLA